VQKPPVLDRQHPGEDQRGGEEDYAHVGQNIGVSREKL
jgi:hypothetical protein